MERVIRRETKQDSKIARQDKLPSIPLFIFSRCHLLLSSCFHISSLVRLWFVASNSSLMDLSDIAKKLELSGHNRLVRKAAEIRRLIDVQFNSSIIGVGEICKAVICLEIAADSLGLMFDRQHAVRLSGMSEKAYTRSFNCMQNGLGLRNKLDVRELAIQFGCVRIIPLVTKGLSLYKDRFLASLPPSRRASADFTRPVFVAVAFYLSAKKHKLKVDKLKLIELCGAMESEFSSVSTSMKDLCYDIYGIMKEKKDSRNVRKNRELMDALPEKRALDGDSSDSSQEPSMYKRRKLEENDDYEHWKASVLKTNDGIKEKGGVTVKRRKQTQLNFLKEVPDSKKVLAI